MTDPDGEPGTQAPQASGQASAWSSDGDVIALCGYDTFVIDLGAIEAETHDPLLIIHGFPTSSADYELVAPALRKNRRVASLDLHGFGRSAKPDMAYTIEHQADVVEAALDHFGIERFSLLTHDMGDTVGGELLARSLDGTFAGTITRRVVTNGSIYIEQAHLTDGQQLLLSLPDEQLPAELAPQVEGLTTSLLATLSPDTAVTRAMMRPHAEALVTGGGSAMLSRTIRYVEQRRKNERRYTGAIETHPSALAIVWGDEDPIAVAEMARTLSRCRPEAPLLWMPGVGHYPQIEDPEGFAKRVVDFLDA